MKLKSVGALLLSGSFLISCASAQISARKDQRDKAMKTSKLYCEFINGETYPDIDVAINLEMSKKCDADKAMSMTSYRSPSEATGIVYCCGMKDAEKEKEKDHNDKKSKKNETGDKKDLKDMGDELDMMDMDAKPSSPGSGSSSPSSNGSSNSTNPKNNPQDANKKSPPKNEKQ